MSDASKRPTRPSRCPICGSAAADPATRPFCSERCRTIDLGQWLGGAYRLPGEAASSAEPESEPPRANGRG